ncbi:MAG TPA: hypothetical protein VKG67_01870 [Gallionellaceae bacterium]|nr:hypothetical protein [Gallionellaceae bacterium]
MNPEPQHTQLNGAADYIEALDTLCALTTRSLCVFEKDFQDIGFNSEKRYDNLRRFLLASPYNRLYLLAHDIRYLAQNCPRMTMLLRQFSHNMNIYRTPQHLLNISEPFAVADETHYVRRFHFDDTRGILAQNDPQGALALHSQFMEMWAVSRPGVSASTTGL